MIRALVATLLSLALVAADPVKLARPMRVELQLKLNTKRKPAELIQYDDVELIVKMQSSEKTYRWIDLTTTNAFAIRKRLIDQRKATDWLALGQFAWDIGARDDGANALSTAVKMDRSLKPQADAILASDAGAALRLDSASPATSPTKSNTGSISDHPPSQQSEKLDPGEVVKYQPASPAEHAVAIEAARKTAKRISAEMGITFSEFQTDHFICFNDWDPREATFLKDNLEGAYATVSRQFEIPVKENVFVGKLPVFMFASHEDFMSFASKIDHFPVPKTVAGYYATMVNTGGEQSAGHMAMWKPDVTGNNVAEAEKRWAYTLVHEFTHAFVARYRTNQRIPRWLNEGVAEVIANEKFPRTGARDFARRMALNGADVQSVFDDDRMPGGEMYPVMMTMVETLIAHDRKAFLRLFDDIKAGADPEAALKTHFGTDYNGLLDAWRKYLTTANGTGRK